MKSKIVVIIMFTSLCMTACTHRPDDSILNNQNEEEVFLDENQTVENIPNEKDSLSNKKGLDEKIKPLEASDFSVTDATNTIILDSPYKDFVFDKPEIPLDNNYVGEVRTGEFAYKVYRHTYEDLDIYTANYNYNLKGRSFDDYYIGQITLNNSTFQTPRGISIGSSMEEVVNAYGISNQIEDEDELTYSYIYQDMEIEIIFDEAQIVKEIFLLTIVENADW